MAKIDKHNLDEECAYLPDDYEEWANIEELAKANYDMLITKRAVVKAEASLELRGLTVDQINRRYRLKLDKVTEQVYKDLVYLHADVVKITAERDAAANQYHVAKAQRQTFDKRKAMLEYLTSLHGQGYFMRMKGKDFKKAKARGGREGVKETIRKRRVKA
jgi:hypothetical protein